MNKAKINTVPYTPNLVCCCIDEYRPGRFRGKLYCSNMKGPYSFKDINDMLLKMDDYFDEINFPMKDMEHRRFSGSRQKSQREEKFDKTYDPSVPGHRGEKATFIIQVLYRQNCSWQGKIVWADQNKAQYFRSELEMIRLIDSALTAESYKREKVSEP